VSLTAPADGSTLTGSVSLAAAASDASTGIAKVEFLVDGTVVGSDTTSPYGVTWSSSSVANGTHSITARATDGTGNQATSSPVSVTTSNTQQTTVMHVASMTMWGSQGKSSWQAWADVTVADQNGVAVSGATVTFSFTWGRKSATRSCTTNASGFCTTEGSKVNIANSYSSVFIRTSNVAKSGASWDGAAWGGTLAR
jgi:hypothetical protein